MFSVPDSIQADLHRLAKNAAGNEVTGRIFHPDLKNKYLIRVLMNEAISSSQLEGAATTTKAALEMLRSGRAPRDQSEQMVVNNYHAMQFIRAQKDEPLTSSIIYELHKIVTWETLRNPEHAGTLRDNDDVVVKDQSDQQTLHHPPKAAELPERIRRICVFANEDEPSVFIDPAVKAIILHFMLAYDHPFEDGNGRTARALFYWMCFQKGYELIEFLSISRTLKKEPGQYKRAYLYTETDDNDLTYFLLHQLAVINKELVALHEFLEKESKALEETEKLLEGRFRLEKTLNPRQVALIKHALKRPGARYTIQEHMTFHGVTYQTARTDLLELASQNLLDKFKKGKTFIFEAPSNLRDRIMTVKNESKSES
ncbi:MAG: Fic family protein [Nitrospinaceae bacterium]